MNVYDFDVVTPRGENKKLSDFRGQVLLIVNTATKCGLAPQFDGLQYLHEKYKDQGLTVLGFPCNQFMDQEPETNDTVEQACKINFGVTFPLMGKVDVNGPSTDPLFQYLKKETGGLFGSGIKWNFTKFLVNREGKVVKRFSPTTAPKKFEDEIVKLLNQSSVGV
ncbi:glutathione peroxidase [Paenibacillus phyllosphaerae]|uniref:Glutathione peroxidase n=1 Tax=Paenibacillus phyllosphaerae TaxID=274593 RepID=A0A7W5B0N0_9BACL|nr:glutathione peroxidase [Paenibacillus phyllosphaerae]MBB3112248.1 glutathione peroxidase [Paenibacillus phyllosphaerae]